MKQILRLPKVLELSGLSESSIWRKEKNGDFPRRIRLGERCVGWLLSDIENWISSKASQNNDAGEVK